ncbi:anthranilate synthase component II [Micromonospora rubida]|uniref:anthranilate synthase component II n=1 Tax=Micromonospora rubida TaxID=2697657 RepID=UPI001378C1FF|nr:aminodeoxychorismate/anthranilate synthase component II [Micromonospora rubida]NBE83284.1 aminodeoxychorismate/anthranilate synthase component II [Micromonospora rubida]
MKVLLVDAYDSFVHIIRQYLLSAGMEAEVVRSDAIGVADVPGTGADALLLGPGPGHPAESGHVELVEAYAGRLPVFGVCLGHQAIGLAFGARVLRARHLMHGKTSEIRHDGRGTFADLPRPLTATRYHSLIVDGASLDGTDLVATAHAADDGYVMALRHRRLPVESVQFHPESVRTQHGLTMLTNFLTATRHRTATPA